MPLDGQSKFITRHSFESDDLAESLDMAVSTDSPDDESFNVSALRYQLRERHLAAEAAAYSATLPEQVLETIGRLAELVRLNDADRRILEFAVLLQNEPYLADTADYLGPLTSTKAYQDDLQAGSPQVQANELDLANQFLTDEGARTSRRLSRSRGHRSAQGKPAAHQLGTEKR